MCYDLEYFVKGKLDNEIIEFLISNDECNIICCVKFNDVPGVINGIVVGVCDWLYTKDESVRSKYNFNNSILGDYLIYDSINKRIVFVNLDYYRILSVFHVDLYINIYIQLCNIKSKISTSDIDRSFEYIVNKEYKGNIQLYFYVNKDIIW